MMIAVLMSILMKAIIHTYNLEKMHFKCLNLNFKLFWNSLNLNILPFWFKSLYEFLLNMYNFNIVENLSSDKPVLTE